ncbi:MAG: aminotransferase class I/II-fold pyridoxal phosphate-dependent enzyme [Acidobacteria bacterium]|nr:aminotransferase class I/II-fold pyridoxal phosphate-dependent enzyme [Acidobacteriota bacterium]
MSGPAEPPLPSFLFLGVRGEGIDSLRARIGRILEDHRRYREEAFQPGAGEGARGEARETAAPAGDLDAALGELLDRLRSNAPYFHPRYAAQMIKDPAVPAVLGYLAAMLINPNNHAYEGGPATTEMELEVVDDLLRLSGFMAGGRAAGWGHLCSGGSLANLEALWAVRDSRPEGPVVFSRASHYSWKRNAALLRIPRVIEAEVDARFRMDPDHLARILEKERPALVVANLGTTGTGSIDPLEAILELRERHGFHLHVDAAYGGYARACLRGPGRTLLTEATARQRTGLSEYAYRQIRALGRADSVTIDPHKHGLSPYGAGAILYRDEALKRPLLNTAPYTYHLADRPNLGTISLEGSRPGAAAAACWLTHRVVPLDASGYGAIVGAGLRVAREFHARALEAPLARPLHEPDLDILCLVRLPRSGVEDSGVTLGAIDRATGEVYGRLSVGGPGRPPVLLSRFNLPADLACRALPFAARDVDSLGALRLVLMKHWLALGEHAGTLEEMMAAVLGS